MGPKNLPLILSVTKEKTKKPVKILSTYHQPRYVNVERIIDKKERSKLALENE